MKPFFNSFLLPFLSFMLVMGLILAPVANLSQPLAFGILVAVIVLLVAYYKYLGPIQGLQNKIVRNGVEVEIWCNYIVKRFWKDNTFLTYAFSDDDKVLAGKIVHIPQPGAQPVVTKNRSSYPATAVRRTDTDIVYTLDEYTTQPTHIPNAETVETSYDKMDSVYGDHAGSLANDAGGDAIVKWLTGIPATSIIRTTGGNTTSVDQLPIGATGTRKKLTTAEVRKAQKMLDKQNVASNDRYMLLSSDMTEQLLEDLAQTQYRDFSKALDPAKGIIGELYGFTLLKRSEVAIANDNGGAGPITINAFGAATLAADHDVAMFWQKDCVTRALGEVLFFDNPDRAEYYGGVYSALLRFGGRRRYANNNGLGAIIQIA